MIGTIDGSAARASKFLGDGLDELGAGSETFWNGSVMEDPLGPGR